MGQGGKEGKRKIRTMNDDGGRGEEIMERRTGGKRIRKNGRRKERRGGRRGKKLKEK